MSATPDPSRAVTVPVPLTADPTRLPDPLSPTPRPLRGPLRPDPDDICDACVAGDCEHCQEDEHFCECLHGEGRPEHFYDPAVIPTAVPDGHTVIGGKLFRLERHGDLNRYGLVRVRPEENPDV